MMCILDACHATSSDTLIIALRLAILNSISIFLILHLDGLTRRESLKSLRLLTEQISFFLTKEEKPDNPKIPIVYGHTVL